MATELSFEEFSKGPKFRDLSIASLHVEESNEADFVTDGFGETSVEASSVEVLDGPLGRPLGPPTR